MERPSLIEEYYPIISLEDFDRTDRISRLIFGAINNLIQSGVKIIDSVSVESYIKRSVKQSRLYEELNGSAFLEVCTDKSNPDNYEYLYKTLKKTSLLRELKENGYDISPFDYENIAPGLKEIEVRNNFDKATQADIFGHIEQNLSSIRGKHEERMIGFQDAADGIDDLLASFKNKDMIGAELLGKYFNSMVQGATEGKLYIRSASTAGGKTRSSVFDACHLVYPYRFSVKHNSFIKVDLIPNKILFVVTEQKPKEVQSMILAFLSGIDESKIKSQNLDYGEVQRLEIAARIMKAYRGYFLIEEINDPDLSNVQNTIKRHVLIDNIKIVFYDYIFTSPALISQFSSTGLREDVALAMLSNQLKEIAKTYNVFIMTATQLNAQGLGNGESKKDRVFDQRALRGSKAIADKADIGCVVTAISKEEKEKIASYVVKLNCPHAPTHVMDLYKMRSGRFKNHRIWYYYDLGNGYREDCFVTTEDNELISFRDGEIIRSILDDAEKVDDNWLTDEMSHKIEEMAEQK